MGWFYLLKKHNKNKICLSEQKIKNIFFFFYFSLGILVFNFLPFLTKKKLITFLLSKRTK